jgi:hypothetical protein
MKLQVVVGWLMLRNVAKEVMMNKPHNRHLMIMTKRTHDDVVKKNFKNK